MPNLTQAKARRSDARTLLLLTTVLGSATMIPAVVMAQSAPPSFRQIDDNGVDILNGSFRIAGPSISIGDSASR